MHPKRKSLTRKNNLFEKQTRQAVRLPGFFPTLWFVSLFSQNNCRLFAGIDDEPWVGVWYTVNERKSIMNRTITKFYDLSDLGACMEDFRYVYSPFSKTHYKFRQDEGYVSNFRNDEMTKNSADGVEVPDYFYGVNPDEYAWIGLFSREKYTAGTKVTLHSFYDHFGGPLVSFGDNYTTDENGHNIYGLYFEVVPWQDGCNYWQVEPSREKKEWSIDPVLLAEPKYHIEDGEMIETVVEFGVKEITTTINGHKYNLKIDRMPESFYVGFACCEAGIGHFVDFKIETE